MKIKIDKAVNPKGQDSGYVISSDGKKYYGKGLSEVKNIISQLIDEWKHIHLDTEDDFWEQLTKGDL